MRKNKKEYLDKILNKEFLIEHYINQNKTAEQIRKEIGCRSTIVSKKIQEFRLHKSNSQIFIKDKYIDKIEKRKIIILSDFSSIHDLIKVKCFCSKIFEATVQSLYTVRRSCGCLKNKENNPAWKGYKDISGKYWSRLIRGARERKIEFNISVEDAWNLIIKQNFICPLTNLNIKLSTEKSEEVQTASLDRIDSSKGYTIDNIQWIYKPINVMKFNYDQEEFIHYCNLVAKAHPRVV